MRDLRFAREIGIDPRRDADVRKFGLYLVGETGARKEAVDDQTGGGDAPERLSGGGKTVEAAFTKADLGDG